MISVKPTKIIPHQENSRAGPIGTLHDRIQLCNCPILSGAQAARSSDASQVSLPPTN